MSKTDYKKTAAKSKPKPKPKPKGGTKCKGDKPLTDEEARFQKILESKQGLKEGEIREGENEVVLKTKSPGKSTLSKLMDGKEKGAKVMNSAATSAADEIEKKRDKNKFPEHGGYVRQIFD